MKNIINIINKIKIFIDQVLIVLKRKYILIKNLFLQNKKVNTENLNHRAFIDFVHINNFYSSAFPFKYLLDFFYSIKFNEENHFIKLTIKVQTCEFKTFTNNNHNNILYMTMDELKSIVIINNIIVNLKDDKLTLNLIADLSKDLIECVFNYSYDNNFHGSIDIIFEYEYFQI